MANDLKSEEQHFVLKLADNQEDLIAAQRLRYRVFVDELGATGPTVDHETQREADEFDAVYDHLLLIDRRIDPQSRDHVVGVYRLLRSEVANAGPGFYSSAEYDLGPLENSGRRLLELGRSCVDADHRGGIAVYLLWNALAEYVLKHEVEVMFGVASYHGTDVSAIAQSLAFLHKNHLAPADARVQVRPDHFQRLDLIPDDQIDRVQAMAQTPALIKAYLRLGGSIGDGAFIDRAFNTIDVCLMMDTARMSERHKQAYTRRSRRGGKS
jgi:putative hemolysin